jgi:hypothetical protein
MSARLVAVALATAAALLDVSGAHGLAGAALVAAVPAGGIAALQALGEALIGSGVAGRVRLVLLAAALVLLVAAAALRAPLTAAEAPPFAAGLALAGALLAFALQALVAAPARLLRDASAGRDGARHRHSRVTPSAGS